MPILLKKSFWDDERKFLEPLMHCARGDVGTKSFRSKSTTDLPVALKSDAAAKTSQSQLSRDFWG